jgi:hypothetical protein
VIAALQRAGGDAVLNREDNRAISFSYPSGEDWKSIDAHNPPAVAAE